MRRWALAPDGDALVRRGSTLLPVLHEGRPAMLKLARDEEEKGGGALMAWWGGRGAAPVLAWYGHAVLLERAVATDALRQLAGSGHDAAATEAICGVAAVLHGPREVAAPSLVPLAAWFRVLNETAPRHGGILTVAAQVARNLLADPVDITALHGDLHHGNVLDFGPRGWLAIDPKGLLGERGFDYANIFRNPTGELALQPGRFERHVELVAVRAGLDRVRLLRWILAFMGLARAWRLADDDPAPVDQDVPAPAVTLAIAEMAAAALSQVGAV